MHSRIINIVKKHSAENENGVILTPSFDLTASICDKLKKQKLDCNIFEHKRGEKLADVLSEFKKLSSKNHSSILVSPSIFEGVSLDDDLSRFIKVSYF